MGLTKSATDASSAGRWLSLVLAASMALGASVVTAQEEEVEPAPDPYIPQSAFETGQEPDRVEQQEQVCNNALGYVKCGEMWHGKQAGPQGPPAVWGALAVSQASTYYGYSYDYPSADQANAAALKSCNSNVKGKSDCKVRSTFARTCIGLATSTDNVWGYSATYADLVATDKEALNVCEKAGGKACTTVLDYCSPNGGFHTWVGLAISMEPKPKAGISWGAPAQTTASKLAYDSCIKDGGTKCKVRVLLHNTCIAFAMSPNGMWGAFWNMARKVAETNAVRRCAESKGTSCAVVLSKCSTDPITSS
jgi:hypothetical protein